MNGSLVLCGVGKFFNLTQPHLPRYNVEITMSTTSVVIRIIMH